MAVLFSIMISSHAAALDCEGWPSLGDLPVVFAAKPRVSQRALRDEILLAGADMMGVHRLLAALLLISLAGAVPQNVVQTIDSEVYATGAANVVGTNSASAGGDDAVVSQGISQVSTAASVIEDASNSATISGKEALMFQSITQIASADLNSVQTAANDGFADGIDAALAQSVSQGAMGSSTSQTISNFIDASGDGANIAQYLAQSGSADDSAQQNPTNTAYAAGDNVFLGQDISSSATGSVVNQVTNNLARLGGDDSTVAQMNSAVSMGDDLPDQGLYNSAYYLPGSSRGAISQQILGSSVFDSNHQIQRNLIG
jgi:hypothetical protein